MPLAITSPAFKDGGEIPTSYTCEGADRSPPLVFGAVPAGAKSLVLIVDDPDAPDPRAPKMTFVHWVVWDLPPGTRSLLEGAAPPAPARVGQTDFRRTTWGGPCPPVGRHRYFFKLFALDAVLGELKSANKSGLVEAMKGHVLEQAQLIGTYEKKGR
ncbi:MAG TPA: YbhB/YbcL family Raf kinase inhibitor-like protein [Anaeromyxobacter sp.]|nr:YbhB/YbcL family Raf kinase inhibitor-like protein [Anaeromyxobacter sp.]